MPSLWKLLIHSTSSTTFLLFLPSFSFCSVAKSVMRIYKSGREDNEKFSGEHMSREVWLSLKFLGDFQILCFSTRCFCWHWLTKVDDVEHKTASLCLPSFKGINSQSLSKKSTMLAPTLSEHNWYHIHWQAKEKAQPEHHYWSSHRRV